MFDVVGDTASADASEYEPFPRLTARLKVQAQFSESIPSIHTPPPPPREEGVQLCFRQLWGRVELMSKTGADLLGLRTTVIESAGEPCFGQRTRCSARPAIDP